MGRNEDTLLAETINDDEDGGKSVGLGKLLDEVHGDGVPGTIGDWELLHRSVGLVTRGLGTPAGGIRCTVVLDERTEIGP